MQKAPQSHCPLWPPEKQAASPRATNKWRGELRSAWDSRDGVTWVSPYQETQKQDRT